MDQRAADFEVRGLELHSLYAWDYPWVVRVLDFIEKHGMNTLVLHRNDFVDLIVYPGEYFGYKEQEGDKSIFDIYSQIFRKLYQYTPTRRSCPYQRRAFLKRVLEEASRRGIKVYIENKELYFPDIILEFYPQLVHDGHVCATDPFWQEFLKVKYREFFREFPEVAGIITSPATGESRVSIKSNRCTCGRCTSTSREDWYRMVLTSMYQPIHEAGRTLVVRDFVFDAASQRDISAVMEELPPDVVISLKNTPHDYYPTFPVNPRIGHVGNHSQWIEFDTMGQYFGWGVGIADLTQDYRRRLRDAKDKGATGAVFRLDWESLDGHSSFFTPNKINVYAAAALTGDLDRPEQEIYRRYLLEEGWSEDVGCIDRQAEWFGNIMKKTWEITAGTVFVNDCVFSDSSVLPISLEHAVWLSEEKNSLKDWDPDKRDCVSPVRTAVEAAVREKEEAFRRITELCVEAGKCPEGLRREKVQWFQDWLALNARYVDMYRCSAEAVLLTRYVTETNEQDGEFWAEALDGARAALMAVRRLEEEFKQLFRETEYETHVIYTLLDADRLDCLYRKLSALLPPRSPLPEN